MSRFLLFGDILSLSEAKGTKTRFLGRRRSPLLLMYYTHVVKARASTNGRKSRDFKIASSSNAIEILSLSLSPSLRKEKQKHTTLSLSLSLSLSLRLGFLSFVQRRCVLRATEREVIWFAQGVSSLSLKSVSLVWRELEFWKKKVTNSMHLNTKSELKKREIFQNLLNCPTRTPTVNEEAQRTLSCWHTLRVILILY